LSERLQKLLARMGLGSRREIERWIEEGLVTVNGRVATLGDQADPDDKVAIRGRLVSLKAAARPRVIAYHKPDGELTTRKDPEGRPTVFDHLPRLRNGRWIAVGRLDYNTSGLLLFTTDGELAARLMHPSKGVEREYAVRILGEVSPDVLKQLLTGVELEDGPARFETLREAGGSGANRWYHVTLREGRNREVRRLWEAVGLKVSRLTRVRYGPVGLDRALRAGRWRDLEPGEMAALYQTAGLSWQPPKLRREARRPPRPPRTARRPKR
jgi:23S rRNA pseudouridine2605 synthase